MMKKKVIRKLRSKVACSVIILSFNTKNITDKCLALLKPAKKFFEKKAKEKIEVIVIDNASKDSSQKMIKKKHPWVKLISLKENSGFAKGNNLGMERAKGKYLLLLNSDTYLNQDTLVKALLFMRKDTSCDVLGCKLTYEGGSLQASAGFLPNPVNVILWMIGLDKVPIFRDYLTPFHPNNNSFFSEDRKVEWITGAFMLLKKRVYEETKGFDENYFMYTEEVEWCKRIIDAGFKIFFTPSFEVIHLKYASSDYDIKKPISKEADGVLYFFNKHYPKFVWLADSSIFTGYLLRMLAFAFLGKAQKFRAYRDYIFERLWRN